MATSNLIPPGRAPVPAGWRTWGDTYSCTPATEDHPSSEDEIVALVTAAGRDGQRVKVVGAGHSFTDIACTDGRLVHLDRYDQVLNVDAAAGLVKVQAGISIEKLNVELEEHGLALRNMGDIAYQSISGAISTSTHGTGAEVGNLASQVIGMSMVLADGSVLQCSKELDPETFQAARVGLGALGVISTVTLQCVPAFRFRNVEAPEPLAAILEGLDGYVDGNDHFEFFFFPHADGALAITNNITDDPARPRSEASRWFNDILVENHAFGLIQRAGRMRPAWIPRLNRFTAGLMSRAEIVDTSWRIFANPRLVRFQEMEYAIPRAAARDAITELRAMIDRSGMTISFPVEVRFGPADDITLSTAHGRDTCYIAVHVFHRMDYQRYFHEVEAIMNGHEGRPHWGKLHFQAAATLATRYPKWESFIATRDRLDPEGRFANDYLDRVLGRAQVAQTVSDRA